MVFQEGRIWYEWSDKGYYSGKEEFDMNDKTEDNISGRKKSIWMIRPRIVFWKEIIWYKWLDKG